MDYIGEKCPVCGKEFTTDDDIVVCPECGTPHHRACYAAENKCANSEYHSTGRMWESTAAVKASVRICPVCHFSNSSNDTNCQRCGTELNDIELVYQGMKNESGHGQNKETFGLPEELADPIKFLGFDEEEDMGGATMKEVSDFVGSNSFYYLPRFRRMKEEGLKPSINLTSFIFPSLYFANRKMWFWAILAACLGILFNLPADILLYRNDFPAYMGKFISDNKNMFNTISDVFLGLDMAARVLSCFFANWLYFRFALRSIKKVKTNRRPLSEIKSSGGIKPINMLFITLIKGGIGFVAILMLYFGFDMISTINDFSTI